MSRIPDSQLKERILDVALTLLRVHGEAGVTLRAVAKAANTTTPTVYKRFRDKAALLLALAMRERDRYVERQSRKTSLESAASGYLDWAIRHPHEYGLIYGSQWPKVFSEKTGRPGLRWTQEQFAARYGGKSEDYEEVVSALWLLLHGTASLLIQDHANTTARYVREKCLKAAEQIIANAGLLSKRRRRSLKSESNR